MEARAGRYNFPDKHKSTAFKWRKESSSMFDAGSASAVNNWPKQFGGFHPFVFVTQKTDHCSLSPVWASADSIITGSIMMSLFFQPCRTSTQRETMGQFLISPLVPAKKQPHERIKIDTHTHTKYNEIVSERRKWCDHQLVKSGGEPTNWPGKNGSRIPSCALISLQLRRWLASAPPTPADEFALLISLASPLRGEEGK